MDSIKSCSFIKGYVIIRVEGLTLERFLNLSSANDIYLWDITKVSYSLLEMKVTVEGFKALKEVVNKVGCRVEIIDKRGLPFVLNRLKDRKMLVFGFVVFFLIIIFLTSLIWDIEIIGNENIKNQEILDVLEKENIKKGIIKYKIDKDYIEYLMLNKFDNLSFLSLDIKGTKLSIQLNEQEIPPEKIDVNTPCNIVANKKGVIEKIISRNGETVVRKGDIVEKGQTLISGVITDELSEKTMLVHADGEIWAKTAYSHKIDSPIIKTMEEETGKVFERKELKIGEKGIQFNIGDIPFKDYIEDVREVEIFGIDLDFPIKILVHEYKEIDKREIKQNIDFLKESNHIKAVEILNKDMLSTAEIQNKDVMHYVDDQKVTSYVVIEVIEDIGQKDIIN